MINNSGPRMDPRGTPVFISKSCDFAFSIWTYSVGPIGIDWSGSYGTNLWQCHLIRNILICQAV